MDLLKRPPLPDDVVHYKLFLVEPDPLDPRANERSLLRLLGDVLADIAPLLLHYIWQKQPINLQYHPEKGGVPAHLGGRTEFGDNVEDEWFIVYLLRRLTHTFGELAATVLDNDGQFLLIEVAEHLPKWLDPDSSENRVFLYQGELHILPNRVRAGVVGWPLDSVPPLQEGLKLLRAHSERCLAERSVRSALDNRLQGYPDKIQAGLHKAHCYVPAGIAAVLSRRPDLVAPAVTAFYLRDPVDLKACRTFTHFPAETRVLTSVTFNRCLYAQLQQQSFTPDRRSGYTLPPRSHPHYRAHELGMKLAHGFEILCSRTQSLSSEGREAPVTSHPLWKGFLQKLQQSDYFRGELEGSARYKELSSSAENFFKQSVASTHSSGAHDPGEEVLHVLESAPCSLEELKKQEANLPQEDSEDWLHITPQELERLLEQRGGSGACRGQGVTQAVRDEEEEREEEASYSLVAVTRGVKDFINATSSYKGAEFPQSCSSEPFRFDPDAVTSALDNLLGGKDEELDSDDFEDEDDDEGEDDDDEGCLGAQEHDGTETLDSLKRYMDEMDLELQTTHIGQSFTYKGQGGDKAPTTQTPPGPVTSGQATEEELQPLDVDFNLVKNLLESLASQAGMSGPASNLLQSMGIPLPPDEDAS